MARPGIKPVRLVNPADRKNPKRKPAAKSKKKSSGRHKPATKRKPKASARKKPAKKGGRKNPMAAAVGYLNGRSSMAKKKNAPKKKSNTSKAGRRNNPSSRPKARHNSASKKKNPSKKRNRYKRNPALTTRAVDFLKLSAVAFGGLVLTRQLPQAILKEKNVGILGYLMNAVTAGLLSFTVGKFSNKANAFAVLIGGGLYTFERMLDEQLTPLGKALSLAGVGDAKASGSLRGIKNAYFPWPVVTDRQGNPIIPSEIDSRPAAAPPALPANGSMGRFASRY